MPTDNESDQSELKQKFHYLIPKAKEFTSDSFTLELTEESKSLYSLGQDGQGYIGLVELDPENHRGKIHLVPSFNKDDGLLCLDKNGAKFKRSCSTEQPLGGGAGDLHTRCAATLGLVEKAGANGLLMGFGVWKGGAGVKFLSELPENKLRLIPDEYLVVKNSENKWRLFYVDRTRQVLEMPINEFPEMNEAIQLLPPDKKPEALSFKEREKIVALLKQGSDADEFKFIKNRSSSQNMFCTKYSEHFGKFFIKALNDNAHGTAHQVILNRELPLPVMNKIINATTAQLGIESSGPLQKSLSVPDDDNDNKLRLHLVLDSIWHETLEILLEANLLTDANIKLLTDHVSHGNYLLPGVFKKLHQLELLNESLFKMIVKQTSIYDELNSKLTADNTDFNLMDAVLIHSPPVRKAILEKAMKMNLQDEAGGTMLHFLVTKNADNLETIFQKLIDNGVDINAKNRQGLTALHRLIKNAEGSIVGEIYFRKKLNYFLNHGADLHAKDNKGFSSLYYAAAEAPVVIFKTICNHPKVSDADKQTMLHMAVLGGNIEPVKYLLTQGVDITVLNEDNLTPMQSALSKGQLGIALYLLVNGATISKSDLEKMHTPETDQEDNASFSDQKLLLFLVKNNLLEKDNLGMIRNILNDELGKQSFYTLLTGQVTVDFFKSIVARQYSHIYPLQTSISLDDMHAFMYRLNILQSDVNKATEAGDTPLHYAIRHRNSAAVNALLDKGADMTLSNKQGKTPLAEAAENHFFNESENTQFPAHLTKIYYDLVTLTSITKDQNKLLSSIAGEKILSRMLDAEKACNVIPLNGVSILHLAAQKGPLELCDLLIHYGLAVDIKDSNGKTPLFYACVSQDVKMVDFMLDKLKETQSKNIDLNHEINFLSENLQPGSYGEFNVSRILLHFLNYTDDRNVQERIEKTIFDYVGKLDYPSCLKLVENLKEDLKFKSDPPPIIGRISLISAEKISSEYKQKMQELSDANDDENKEHEPRL